ncbi:MAG: ribbon-helix-helix protein, CopG family, partial [Chloroflexi bacterium]|nr:ribbon-helix-helix protein, CopG family [Chloroflexota bacterium]
MQRTTIMAEEGTLARLREIAHQEGRSLAEVIRQALDER